MRTLFYERLTAVLFGIAKTSGASAIDDWPKKFPKMRADWHLSLRRQISTGGRGPNQKTTMSWIAGSSTKRKEPRPRNRDLLVEATLQYFSEFMHSQNKPLTRQKIENSVGQFTDDELVSIAERMSITSIELASLFPEIANVMTFMSPPSGLRKRYDAIRIKDDAIHKIEGEIANKLYYLYRCSSSGPAVYRCRLRFAKDDSGRLTSTFDDGKKRKFRGMAYVNEKAITVVLLGDELGSKIAPEIVCLCIGYDPHETEWCGVITGLTDSGHDPCSGRILVHAAGDNGDLESARIAENSWPKDQLQLFFDYVSPGNAQGTFRERVLVADRNILFASQSDLGRIIKEL